MAKLSDDGAMKLLEAMCKDSAADLKDGMWLYINGRRKMLRALEDFGNGLATKREGIKKMREEYKFLNGERPVKPLVDGEYVMAQLVRSVFDDLDEDDDFAKMLEGGGKRDHADKTRKQKAVSEELEEDSGRDPEEGGEQM